MIIESNKGLMAFGYCPVADDYAHGQGKILKKPFRIVQYAFRIAELQEEVYGRTASVARHTPTKDGVSQFDKGTLSVDERETFDRLCKQAANEVARVVMPFLPNAGRAYLYDIGYVTRGPVKAGGYAMSGGKLYMALVDSDVSRTGTDEFEELDGDVSLSAHFICRKAIDVFENSLQLTEESIREMLVLYVMKEWFGDVLPERWEQYTAKYEKAREDLRYNLNMMDRPVRGGHPF